MTAKQIKEKALTLGFASCGIIPSAPFPEYAKALDDRIKAFPESRPIYESLYKLATPPQNGKSIIVCISGYSHYKVPESMAKSVGKYYLFDLRLDYTEEFRATAEFTTCLKNAGIGVLDASVPDRLAAAKAGLGKFGRNNFFFTEEHGSHVVIHTWVVDAELDCDPICTNTLHPECSEKCLACVHSCPTNALCGSLTMNRGKCITHMSNNTKSLPDHATMKQMGIWLYGCDACQDVCPLNAKKLTEQKDFPLLTQYEKYMQPETILEMDENTYKNVINPRFWYIGEDGLWLWKCNALRAMINDGSEKYHPIIKKYSNHDHPRIREVAQWGCAELRGNQGVDTLSKKCE